MARRSRLAEFLALDMIPESYRPSKRERAHRILVRQWCYLSRRVTSVRNRFRPVLSNYDADREDLFTVKGLAYLNEILVLEADRFVPDQLASECRSYTEQMEEAASVLHRWPRTRPPKRRMLARSWIRSPVWAQRRLMS